MFRALLLCSLHRAIIRTPYSGQSERREELPPPNSLALSKWVEQERANRGRSGARKRSFISSFPHLSSFPHTPTSGPTPPPPPKWGSGAEVRVVQSCCLYTSESESHRSLLSPSHALWILHYYTHSKCVTVFTQ